MNLYGNRLLIVNDTLDQTKPPVEMNLFAEHKNMLPCVRAGFGNTNRNEDYYHQANQSIPSLRFAVTDENRTLGLLLIRCT